MCVYSKFSLQYDTAQLSSLTVPRSAAFTIELHTSYLLQHPRVSTHPHEDQNIAFFPPKDVTLPALPVHIHGGHKQLNYIYGVMVITNILYLISHILHMLVYVHTLQALIWVH